MSNDDETPPKCDQCEDGVLFDGPCFFCIPEAFDEEVELAKEDLNGDVIDAMIGEMFNEFMAQNDIHGKSLPDGVLEEDFVEYIAETVQGDLPCNTCSTGDFDGDDYTPWYKCPHGFKHGPMTPKKKNILAKLKVAKAVDAHLSCGIDNCPICNWDDEELEQDENGELVDGEQTPPSNTINLGDKQAAFINLSGKDGPNDESFLDPMWTHCDHNDCESCYQHTLHHGIQNPIHNPKGETATIWEQCIEKFGEHDIFGKPITTHDLMAYKHQNPFSKPSAPAGYTGSFSTQTKAKQEEKKMKTMIAAKGRAKKIMKVVERFDLTWRDGGQEGFFNTIRCSPVYLRQFLEIFLNNLLKKEAVKIFRLEMDKMDNSLGAIPSTRSVIEDMVEDYYSGLSQVQKTISLGVMSDVICEMLNEVIDSHLASGTTMGDIHRRMTVSPSFAQLDPRDQVDFYLNGGSTGPIDSILLKAYLTYDNDEGSTLPLSQKARGIHAIGRNTTGLRLFNKLPSLHISVQTV